MMLVEGLKEGDLEMLVDDVISIDEFESKLDDDSVVVGFYVEDKDPAEDLNRFIQKSAIDVLDTDVSPAPNADGKFMVFIELLRDHDLPKKIVELLANLRGLVSVEEWRMTAYGTEGEVEVNIDNLKEHIRLISMEDHIKENIVEFFKHSELDDMVFENNKIYFRRGRVEETVEFVDFGSLEELTEGNPVMTLPVLLDESTRYHRRVFESLLGDYWLMESMGEYAVLSRYNDDKMLLVRL